MIPYPACPLCDGRDAAEIARGDCTRHETYQAAFPRVAVWKRCQACCHIFRDGYFADSELQAIIAKTMRMQTVGSNYEAARIQAERTIDLVLPFHSAGIWLDVGFGDGSLLRTVKEFGFLPLGIDLRKDNVEALRKLGVPAFCKHISETSADPRCRVLSMQYVLAHLPFPRAALTAARRLLEDDGVLVVSTPNAESSLWEEWERAHTNPYWGEIECFHHFGKTGLYRLLREHGFEPVRYAIGRRYRACLEVIARKLPESSQAA